MVMLNNVLSYIKNKVESSLQAGTVRDEDWVALSNLVGNDGAPADGITDKIVMSVASIQSDTKISTYSVPRGGGRQGYPEGRAPLYVDLYVLFASCFTGANYAAGLGLLSRIITYFQENPVVDASGLPELASETGQITVDYVALDFAQSSYLTTQLGLKGQPFVVYRLRRLPFDGPAITGVAPAVQATPPPSLSSR